MTQVLPRRPLTPAGLDAIVDFALDHGVPSVLRMNARDYADVRMFGRDVLGLNLGHDDLKAGRVAVFRSVEIVVSKEVGVGIIHVMEESGREIAHVSRPSWEGEAYCHSGAYSSCLDDSFCAVAFVMES